MKIRLTIIAGARPNFMKIAPIIDAIGESKNIQYRLVHTGQHYDEKLSGSFFKDLNIPTPDVNLGIGSGSQAEQTGSIMKAFEKELISNPCDYVLLVGDVNSTLACAIVAKKLQTRVIHVEAGLRSGDLSMPEEINRMVVDAISDVFFTTTQDAADQLIKEGHSESHIYFTGNVMIDSVVRNMKKFRRPKLTFNLEPIFFVLTLHRPSNVDDSGLLVKYLEAIASAIEGQAMVIFPIHPRTQSMLGSAKLPNGIIPCDPLPYPEFMYLVQQCKCVITDSGGIQEETTFLGVPCLTLRENTERPETIYFGTNELIGRDFEKLKSAINRVLQGKWKKGQIPNLWDGLAATRIVETLTKLNSEDS